MPDFKDICLKIKGSGKPFSISVRDLMKSIGRYQRDVSTNHELRNKLSQNNLTTKPEFELANFETKIKVLPLITPKKATKKAPKKEATKASRDFFKDETSPESHDEDLAVIRTIGHLPSAVREPVRIGKNESLQVAITKMLHEGVDHLVVAQSPRNVEGIVTWASIVRASAGSKTVTTVSGCMEKDPCVVPFDTPLFDAVREITRRGLALILSQTKTIAGSVTTVDIAEQFVILSEPFLFIEQIENHLRSLLRSTKLDAKSVKNLVNPKDEERKARTRSVSDLTFGEILRAFEDPKIWESLQLNLDRKLVVKGLYDVNLVRNRVMHFHPDGISNDDREVLRKMRSLLQIL